MKKSAIIDIFSGLRGNAESLRMPKDNDNLINNAYGELKAKLSPEIFGLLQKFTDALKRNFCDEAEFYYAEGFKLGSLIGVKCMDE